MPNKSNNLTSSNIKYILTIKEFKNNADGVRSTNIAKAIGITKPSVHTMVKSLQKIGLLKKDKYGLVHFTELGKRTSECYNQYYNILSTYINPIITDKSKTKSIISAMLAEMSENEIIDMCNQITKQ